MDEKTLNGVEHATNWIVNNQSVIIEYGLHFIGALLILIIGNWFSKALSRLIGKTLEKNKLDLAASKFLQSLIRYAVLTAIILMALNTVGIQTASFIALLASAGLAIGLALQGTLSQFASGVVIIATRPYKIGDTVIVGGKSGTVIDMDILYTTLKTPDNVKIIVPNGSINGKDITNYSAFDTRRLEIIIGVGYDSKISEVKEVIHSVIKSDERSLLDPEPLVEVNELNASSIDMVVRVWSNRADLASLKYSLLENIKVKLDEKGISIPYPQLDIHMTNSN